ncbi:unnamed protein product [Fusarium langsethiae]|nr:unnamed protein product [Fusarium langsethiae]
MYFTNVFVAALAAQAFSRDGRVSSSGTGKLAALMALGAAPGSALPIFTTVEVREVIHNDDAAADISIINKYIILTYCYAFIIMA